MRRLLSPRWLAWHVLVVVVAITFVRLGLWQWDRAVATRSPQNMGYALQWPVFALFGIFFWYRTVRDALRTGPVEPAPPRRTRRPVPPPAEPVEVTDEEDPELAAYNRYLARLNESAEAKGERR